MLIIFFGFLSHSVPLLLSLLARFSFMGLSILVSIGFLQLSLSLSSVLY